MQWKSCSAEIFGHVWHACTTNQRRRFWHGNSGVARSSPRPLNVQPSWRSGLVLSETAVAIAADQSHGEKVKDGRRIGKHLPPGSKSLEGDYSAAKRRREFGKLNRFDNVPCLHNEWCYRNVKNIAIVLFVFYKCFIGPRATVPLAESARISWCSLVSETVKSLRRQEN